MHFQPLAIFGIILLIIFVALAIFAPWIAPFDPAAIHLHARLQSPSAAHWFGTDELGRDILSRVIYGTRISLMVATSVVSIALFFGVILGSIAGFYGGWVDAFLNVLIMNIRISSRYVLQGFRILTRYYRERRASPRHRVTRCGSGHSYPSLREAVGRGRGVGGETMNAARRTDKRVPTARSAPRYDGCGTEAMATAATMAGGQGALSPAGNDRPLLRGLCVPYEPAGD